MDSLITLTVDPRRYASPDQAFYAVSPQVRRLTQAIRRRYPTARVAYFLVWERTAAGWPHAHLLFRGPYIPQAWLSRTWEGLTGAPVVDIRHVETGGQLLTYLAKYLAKDPAVPYGFHRFRSTPLFFGQPGGWRGPRAPGPSPWSLWREPLDSLADVYIAWGYEIAWERGGGFVATASKPLQPPDGAHRLDQRASNGADQAQLRLS